MFTFTSVIDTVFESPILFKLENNRFNHIRYFLSFNLYLEVLLHKLKILSY